LSSDVHRLAVEGSLDGVASSLGGGVLDLHRELRVGRGVLRKTPRRGQAANMGRIMGDSQDDKVTR
jgi:hypothetical protein